MVAIKAHMIDTVLYTIEIVLVGGCGTHALHLNDKSNTGAVGACESCAGYETEFKMENKMIAKKILISASAAAMAFAPVAASAAPVAVERSSASAKDTSELGGAGLIIAILAGIAVVAGVIIAADDDDDTPVSV